MCKNCPGGAFILVVGRNSWKLTQPIYEQRRKTPRDQVLKKNELISNYGIVNLSTDFSTRLKLSSYEINNLFIEDYPNTFFYNTDKELTDFYKNFKEAKDFEQFVGNLDDDKS